MAFMGPVDSGMCFPRFQWLDGQVVGITLLSCFVFFFFLILQMIDLPLLSSSLPEPPVCPSDGASHVGRGTRAFKQS